MSYRTSVNVRYLLWRKGVPRTEWEQWLAARTAINPRTVKSLVSGTLADEQVSAEDGVQLGLAFELADEGDNLRFADFASDGCDVLVENLKFLFNTLGRGAKKALSRELGVVPTTVSRWLNRSFQPHASTLKQLVSHFGLPPDTDLCQAPVFLSSEPVSMTERRSWLHGRLDALSLDELRELYPALRRLLEER